MRQRLRRPLTRRASLLAAAGVLTGGAVAATTVTALSEAPERTTGTTGLFLLGDSWGAGLHADPAHALGQVAAAALGWRSRVDALSGTGYLTAAGSATYVQRARVARGTERLVIVQGGSNDGGGDLDRLSAAVGETVRALASGFPYSGILLLGPGPDPEPVTDEQWRVDTVLAAAAERLDVPYVSMLQEQWVPPRRSGAVLDPVNGHPTTRGQRYLGLRLAASLQLLLPEVLALPA